jgi:hypothetical protein
VLGWVHNQSDAVKEILSRIVFQGHNNYVLMDNLAGATDTTLIFGENLAVDRDLNRHRPWEKFLELMSPILYSKSGILEILGRGFTVPKYLTDIPEFTELGKEYAQDMKVLFESISKFIGTLFEVYDQDTDLSSVLNLLPLGLYQELVMHGNPRQGSYMTNQRARPGGDIDYTISTWEANRLLVESSPLMAGIAISTLTNLSKHGIDMSKKPDPADRVNFFNRG